MTNRQRQGETDRQSETERDRDQGRKEGKRVVGIQAGRGREKEKRPRILKYYFIKAIYYINKRRSLRVRKKFALIGQNNEKKNN